MRGRPSWTAEIVCLMRASDQWRDKADRILDDPYAPLFLSPALRAIFSAWPRIGALLPSVAHGMTNFVLMRHRFIDDALAAALGDDFEQVVLLGAGYDTRAYRFAETLNGRPIFEVDFPTTGERKARLVQKNADVLPVAAPCQVSIDFQSQRLDDRLHAAGFAAGAKTFFVWEGVSMYLTRQAVKATLSTVSQIAATGSQIALDFWSLPDAPDLRSTTHRLGASLMTIFGEPVTFSMHPEDIETFVNQLGFAVSDIAQSDTLQARYADASTPVMEANFVALLGVN